MMRNTAIPHGTKGAGMMPNPRREDGKKEAALTNQEVLISRARDKAHAIAEKQTAHPLF